MIADSFHAMAALRGWTTETKLSILLNYIGRQGSDAAFFDFLSDQRAHPAIARADLFLWTVAERLQQPGLALDAAFQLFWLDTLDLFMPEEVAFAWRQRCRL